MAANYKDRLRIPLEGDNNTRFETSTGLHVATGYMRVVSWQKGPLIEFLSGNLIWDSLHIPDQEKFRATKEWKDKVFYVEWRTKDQSKVKVIEQKKIMRGYDFKVGLFYISPFDLYVDGKLAIAKKSVSRESNAVDLFRDV
jgi:hypothetical protein